MTDNGFTTKEILVELSQTVDQRFDKLENSITGVLRDQEYRIRKLEKYAWSRPASVITAVVSACAAIVAALYH